MKRLTFIVILFLIVANVEASISLSLEEYSHNFFAKEKIERTLFICNETLEPKDIVVRWNTSVFSAVLQKGEEEMELRELQGKAMQLTLEMPEVKQHSPITFKVQVLCDGKLETEKQWDYFVFPQNIVDTIKNIIKNKKLGLIDSSGKIKQIFDEFEIPFTPLTNQLSIGAFKGDLIIVGSEEDPRWMSNILLTLESKAVEGISTISFQEGIDIEDQFLIPLTNISSLPLDIKHITILSPNHPVFSGLTENDFNNWREDSVVTRFPLTKPIKGNFRILAEADLSTAAMAELISGEGKFIFCQLTVIDKFQEEPIAQILFANLIRYALIKQEPLQPVAIYGNSETEIIKILNSLGVAKDTTEESELIIVCLGGEPEETPKKEPTPIPPHIKETIEKGGTILLFASFPEAIDFLGIKENIKRMKIAPTGQQRIYYLHEEIIALDSKNPFLMGMNEDEINSLMKRGKMYKFQLGNADIMICQAQLNKDDTIKLRALSQLLTNLGIKIEKEEVNETDN